MQTTLAPEALSRHGLTEMGPAEMQQVNGGGVFWGMFWFGVAYAIAEIAGWLD